jgi:peptide deformylase
MEIKLLKEDDPKLREVSEPWNFETDGDPTELVKAMTKIMFESGGIGLAAPQCGVKKRIFLMGNQEKLIVCINPEILESSGENRAQEGCLSFPKLWLTVKRPETVKVKYQQLSGNVVEQELGDLPSRVFQHEFDHLNGICFDTKVAKLGLQLAKERRKRKG